MNKFGSVLTGREFGKETLKIIVTEYPVTLDFAGIITLGSSYADEVLIPIAARQNNQMDVCNVNTPVWDCIQDVTKDGGIKVNRIV
jgi:hypothetical protein